MNQFNRLSRRDFIRHTAKGAFASLMMPMFACHKQMFRMNVLVIICDDLNDALEGMGGHPQAKTPNIDKLMQQGLQFTHAHSNNPLCGPSRASVWNGLYPHTTGYYGYNQNNNIWRNNPLLKDNTTVFEHFYNHGYDILGTGKIFHNNQATYPLFKTRDGSDSFGIRNSFGPFPFIGKSNETYSDRIAVHPAMKPPFGAMAFEAFAPLSDVPQVPPDPDKGIPGYTGWREGTEPFHYESETDRDLMADEKNVIWVSEQLQKPRKNPFFMAVGMNRPHSPWFAPKKYFDMFPLDTIQLPPYLENDLEDCAEILWKEAKHHPLKNLGMSRLERLGQAYGGTNEGWKRWIQAYLACAAFVDDQVGKILDSLEKSEFADNTIVVFTSDHGFHMGEKDLLCKRTVWEESTRVPFVCKVPRLTPKGAKCEHPVSLVDLYPTLNELCGLPAPDIQYSDQRPLDGFSLIPFLKHPEYDRWEGPDVALSCIYGDKELELNEPGKPQDQHFTVRSRQYRYSRCADGSEELYDHQNDPHEWHNLASEPKYKEIKQKLKTEMNKLVHRSS